MTGRITMRAATQRPLQSLLTGERIARIPGDPASRSYYPDKGPALFR